MSPPTFQTPPRTRLDGRMTTDTEHVRKRKHPVLETTQLQKSDRPIFFF